MSQVPDTPPGWLNWITPILGAVTVIGGGVMCVLRRLLIGFIQAELEHKHKENRKEFEEIKEVLAQQNEVLAAGTRDRAVLHDEMRRITERLAYMTGAVRRDTNSDRY